MRIVFMGTPDFAVPSLEALAGSRHSVAAVVTRPDRPRGRGQRVAPPEVKAAAERLGLPVLQPERLQDTAFIDRLKALVPDLFVVVAFVVLPRAILALPRKGAINLHPSLLPRYRGAAPIPWAILRGEVETGLTTFRLSQEVDAGDILLQRRVAIGGDETAGELAERLKRLGADLVVETVDGLEEGTARPRPQADEGTTTAPKLSREDGRIDWARGAGEIRNRVRGTNPFPGAFTIWASGVLKVHRASLAEGSGEPGAVVAAHPKTGLAVATGEGALRLDEVQPQGKARMDGASLVRGYRIAVGMKLGS